jgi:hypothetical protein
MTVRFFTDVGAAILLAVPTLALAKPDAPAPAQVDAPAAPQIVTAREAYEDRYLRMRQSPFTA